MSNKPLVQTYQSRPPFDDRGRDILRACAQLMSQVERSLFARMMAGSNPSNLKSDFLKIFGITARHFNACRVQVEGKIDSVKEVNKQRITDLEAAIEKLQKKIKKLHGIKLFFARQRLNRLTHKLEKLKADQEAGIVRICFGGRKLFHKQFEIDHEQWQEEWQKSRNNSFFTLGSKDETGGNQTCTAREENGSLTLRLRLPDALGQGKYLEITNVYFAYGQDALLLVTYGKSKAQSLALIGDAAAYIVEKATVSQKPLVLEKLNFQQKKRDLGGHTSAYKRMLSSFSYNRILQALYSRAYRHGIEVKQVNPAYTSLIGRIKFAKRYGLSIHQAAALTIGRRILGLSEKLPSQSYVPDNRGCHILFSVPARKQKTQIGAYLRGVAKQLQAALVEHFRLILHQSSDPPKGL
jgi:IS605 OrfB family transposase